jgi:hypothetical protein|tara:strand:- start:98 stop:577 length:480 start_codon:yes stop_codon:yes gene_type:complete
MYLCKRKANKFRNLATLIFLNIAILGCSFSPVNSDSEIIVNKIKFDLSVPIKIKNNLNIFVKENEASSTEVNIIGFEFKENNFYGGENLGSLESEVVGSIQVYILNDEEHSKRISSSKRFNTQSLNPLAQKELVKLMRVEIIEDLNKKIVLYLETHEDK